ncbi:MAG: late competence development ComFB family protein [Treponema sp.]|nr:late competence development ComFB family protein [Treponema sp.]
MELHNTVEDIIISRVNGFFGDIKNQKNPSNLCVCDQCRMDTICYVLNRTTPHYIVSNRGVARVQGESLERQQQEADMTALIYEALKRVNHNQRPNFDHSSKADETGSASNFPVYNVPTILGRVFNGNNFAPLSGVDAELLWNGNLVPMKDGNWQNPYHIISNTEGSFSFWPLADAASGVNKHKIFEYTLRLSAPGFETLTHFFKIPVASEIQKAGSFTLQRTFKLPDLYMFPPGEAEQNG